jgi:hypothetical protein
MAGLTRNPYVSRLTFSGFERSQSFIVTPSKRTIVLYLSAREWQELFIRLGLSVGLLVLAIFLASKFG